MARVILAAAIAGLAALAPLPAAADAHVSGDAPAAALPAAVAMIGTGLHVADLEKATAFYRDGLGLDVVGRIPLGEKEEVILGFGGGSTPPLLFLVGWKDKDAALEDEVPSWNGRLVLAVADLDAVRARLTAAGYPPGEVHTHAGSGTKLFWATDADGHRIEIIQPVVPDPALEVPEEAHHG